MKKEPTTQQVTNLRKLEGALGSLSRGRTNLPHGFSISERMERVATDSPFQFLRKQFVQWQFDHTPTKKDIGQEDDDSPLNKAYRAWVFGRPISKEAKRTYQLFRNMGVSRRDLRIAIFTKIITKDGSIKINWWKIRLTQALSGILMLITIFGLMDLAIRLHHSPTSWWLSLSILGFTASFFTVMEYPLFVLGFRQPKVASQIQKLNPPQLQPNN